MRNQTSLQRVSLRRILTFRKKKTVKAFPRQGEKIKFKDQAFWIHMAVANTASRSVLSFCQKNLRQRKTKPSNRKYFERKTQKKFMNLSRIRLNSNPSPNSKVFNRVLSSIQLKVFNIELFTTQFYIKPYFLIKLAIFIHVTLLTLTWINFIFHIS